MNRSFRSPDSKIPGQRPGIKLTSSLMKEKEEELSLFLEMHKRDEERKNLLLHNTVDTDRSLGSKRASEIIFKIETSTASRKIGCDDFLNSEGDKNDYDWLLTPPGTPLFPSLEKESHGSPVGQIATPKVHPSALKSRLSVPQPELAPRGNPISRQPISASSLNTSSTGLRRPSSSASTSSAASRPSTPTGRSTLPAVSKASRPATPTSRTTLPVTKPAATSVRPTASARPSTPSARSSMPTARPTLPASKTSSRPSTPTRRSMPSAVSTTSGPPDRSSSRPFTISTSSAPSGQSSSVPKSSFATSRNIVPSRGASPTVRSRSWQPSKMPGFSLDAPPNLRTSMHERPVSASRGRPGAPSAIRSSASEANSNGRPRRQSCSPTGLRGRAPNTGVHVGGSLSTSSRLHSNDGDNVSPVVIGSKMVERVVNLRRLAPPRQDDQRSTQNNFTGKSSPDSTGFGRTLSKKSLDMALRHMDIRRTIPGNLRPLMMTIPASSMYSIRSGPVRSRPISISDSPLATSSNASSEQSVNDNSLCPDVNEMEDDDLSSEKGSRSSPTRRHTTGSVAQRNASDSGSWLYVPEIRENHV